LIGDVDGIITELKNARQSCAVGERFGALDACG
jgi:hypothetical protein